MLKRSTIHLTNKLTANSSLPAIIILVKIAIHRTNRLTARGSQLVANKAPIKKESLWFKTTGTLLFFKTKILFFGNLERDALFVTVDYVTAVLYGGFPFGSFLDYPDGFRFGAIARIVFSSYIADGSVF